MHPHDDAPLVSIIIPAYNAAARIAETLRSVIDQDYPNIEIIVVNDCSTDETAEIARDVLERSGRPFKLIEHEMNRGECASRNTAIDAASGELLWCIDADDMAEPYLVSRFQAHIQDADIVVSGLKNLNIGDDANTMTDVRIGLASSVGYDAEMITYLKILDRIKTSVCTMMIKKRFVAASDLRFTEGCMTGGDVEFQIKAFARARKIAIVDDCPYIYVHHVNMGSVRDNDTHAKRLKRYRDNTDATERTAEYLLTHTSSDLLRRAAEDLMLPEVAVRRLTILAREGNREGFMKLASDRAARKIIRRSYRSFFQKPEVFFKAALILLSPKLYYRLRSAK